MNTWFDDWIGEFYALLEEGGWIPYKAYYPWFNGKGIKKQRLATAIEKKKVKFRLIIKENGEPIELLDSKTVHQRQKIIEDLWALRSKTRKIFDLQLDAPSLLAWLKENYPLEEEVKITPQKNEPVSSSTPQSDTQGLTFPAGHEFESSLLKIAVECWKALYEDAGPDGKKIRKPQIEKWVEEHYPEVSANSRKTISTIVNPFKKGGASPSD